MWLTAAQKPTPKSQSQTMPSGCAIISAGIAAAGVSSLDRTGHGTAGRPTRSCNAKERGGDLDWQRRSVYNNLDFAPHWALFPGAAIFVAVWGWRWY